MRVILLNREEYSHYAVTSDQGGRSPGRPGQARTRLARAAVIDAGRTLFLERGYGTTTIEAISALSDVPPATVYRLFSSKRGILKAILDVSIVGDDQAVPLAERPHVRALFADPDPTNQLAGFVAVASDVNSRTAPVYRILASAASSDPDAAALLEDLNRQRQAGQGQIARSLARAGALRPGLPERDAADIIHALMSPEVYRLLVVDRGWPPEQYERWLTKTLVDQVLPPPDG
jgi:AcrR family transcriptional regulator